MAQFRPNGRADRPLSEAKADRTASTSIAAAPTRRVLGSAGRPGEHPRSGERAAVATAPPATARSLAQDAARKAVSSVAANRPLSYPS